MEQTVIVDPKYVDDGSLRTQDDVPLARFLSYQDRSQLVIGGQPFFSGREREVRAFREMANALSDGAQGNTTLVVEGPPGAGKSALMMQFVEEMRHLPNTERGERRWLPVILAGAEAECPGRIADAVDHAIGRRLALDYEAARNSPEDRDRAAEALAALVGPDAVRRASHEMGRFVRAVLDRGFAAAGVRIGGEDSRRGGMRGVVNRRAPAWADWQVVLLIDEAQGISGQVPDAVPGTLSFIHQGLAETPISFCAFGLPGTWDALSKVDVSRTSAFHDLPLAGLDCAESRMAVDRCFERFGVRDSEAWARAIVDRSAGWPQHLSAYLNGALSALKERAGAGDEVSSARGASLRSAIALGDEARRDYYRRRLQRLDRDNPRHRRYGMDVARWLRGPNQPLPVHEALDRLGREHGLSDEAGTAFLAAARHSGLLAEDADGNLTAPIPSFAGHLLGEALPDVQEPHPEPSPSSSRSPMHSL